MAKKRSKATARNRIRPAIPSRVYTLAGVLLLFMVGVVVAAQMLWAEATPETAAVAAAPITPTVNNVGGEGNAAGDNTARTLNLYGGGMRPLVEERGGVQTLNIYGPGGRIIAQVVRDSHGSEEVRYLLTDHLGSTRAVVDAEGNAVARYEYGPHGETTVGGSNGTEVAYRYTGHPYDEGQEVYETLARTYDPTLGRFLSVDPQRQDASPYVYAGNNPVGYVDPTGGGKVPVFMGTGFGAEQTARVFNPLSALLSPGGFTKLHNSSNFNTTQINRGSRVYRDNSFAARNPSPFVYGQGKTRIERNDELFWFITDQTDQQAPDQTALSLERMRGVQSDSARRIVLLDFSETGKGDAIRRGIPEDFASITHIKAKLADNWGAAKGTYTPGYEVGEAYYTAEGFVQYVRRQMSGQEVGATPLSTYQSDDVTRLDVPEATRGESTQFDVPTVIQKVEQDTNNISTPRSSTGHPGEPIDVAGFHEFPLMHEDYQTTHVDTDLLSAFERVPEGAWGMLDP